MLKKLKPLISASILVILLITPLSVFATNPAGFDDLQNNENGAEQAQGDKDGFLNDDTIQVLEKFKKESGFRSFTGNSNRNAINQDGLDSLTGIIFTIIDIVKYTVGTIAVIMIMMSIIKLITAGSEKSEEEYGKVKNQLLYSVIAVFIIISLEFFFTNVFNIGTNNFLENTTTAKQFALAGAGEIRGIYNFIQAALAAIAITVLVFSGMKVVTNAGDEEELNNLKRQVTGAIAGLLLVAFSEFVVKDIVFVGGGESFNVENGKKLFVMFTNFVSGFIAFGAFISFIYGGYLYVTSGTLEDKSEDVKRIFIGGIIGLLLAAGAFGIVNTFVELDSDQAPAQIQGQLNSL